MSRTRTKVDLKHTDLLREKVVGTFGRRISRSFECETLSRQVKKVTGEYLSPQTLRRFFGFLDSGFNPAVQSLNILSRYCGYFDWDDFVGHLDNDMYVPPTTSQSELQVYLDFYKLKLKDERDINFHNACRIINTRIFANKALFESMASPLAENPVSQVYFYERFPYIDGLCSGYERGVKLYLQNKPDDQAQVFGLCLLILGAFLSRRDKLLPQIFTRLRRYPLDEKWHPFIIGRFIGSHLLYYSLIGQEDAKLFWLEQAGNYGRHFSSTSRIDYWNFPYYQFMICDYLNLIEEYRLAHELVFRFRDLKAADVIIEDGYYDAFRVIEGVSVSALGRGRSLGRGVESDGVDFQKLGICFEKYFTIQYLIGSLRSIPTRQKKKRKPVLERIDQLIGATGFVYFREFIK